MIADYTVTLHVLKYIADPYVEANEAVVDIQKKSGFNRARSQDRREKALLGYLETINLTVEDYHALEAEAAEQWYRNGDGKIIIPRHQLAGCLVAACPGAPAGARMDDKSFRSLVQIGDFTTTKDARDGVFSRMALPKDGRGKALSNQRTRRKNDYIEDFDATGIMGVDLDAVKPEQLRALLTYAGKYTKVGACRVMGYGQFEVKMFEAGTE